MNARRGPWGLLLLVALSTVPVVAADPGVPLQAPNCASAGNLCPPEGVQGPEFAPPGAPAPAMPKAGSALDRIGSFFAGAAAVVGSAAGALAGATVAGAAAIGGAVAALFRGYAELLLRLRPEGMPADVYAGLASGATAVVAAGAQIGLWAAVRRLAPLLGSIPLFSRIDKDALLENERRSKIFEYIRQNPGVHLSEIARGLQLSWGSCLHHLRKLRADRLILFKEVGHHKCFFLNGSGLSEKEIAAASVVKGDTVQRIAAFIQSHPRTNLKAVAAAVQISSPLAAFHVRKLEQAGLVLKTRDGKSIRLEPVGPLPAGLLCPPTVPALSAALSPV